MKYTRDLKMTNFQKSFVSFKQKIETRMILSLSITVALNPVNPSKMLHPVYKREKS